MPLWLVAVVVSACFVLPAMSQEPEGRRGQETRQSVAGQIELPRLLDLAAERLRITVDYDPGQLKGPVTVRAGTDISDHELWQLANRVLASRGFTTVRVPGTEAYAVVKISDAPGATRIEDSAAASGEPAPGFRSVVVRARHRPAKDLAEALGKVLSKPAGSAALIGNGGLLLVSDLSARIDEAMELLRLLDVPGPEVVTEEISVREATAAQVLALLGQVSAKRESVSGDKIDGEVLAGPGDQTLIVMAPASAIAHWRSMIATLDRRQPVQMVTYTPRNHSASDVGTLVEETVRDLEGASDERWRVVVDDLTDSLVVTATAAQHAAVRALIERLDQAPAAVRRPMRAFVVRNREVEEVVRVLEQLLRAGVLSGPAVGVEDTSEEVPSGAFGEPGAVRLPLAPRPPDSPAQQASPPEGRSRVAGQSAEIGRADSHQEPVSLTVDEGTNTIIAFADSRVLSQIEELIRTLDVRQPQVMLEVLMLSLSESQALELGAELEQITIAGSVRIRLASLFGLGTRDSAGNRVGGDGSGFTGVILSPGDFSMVVRALQSVNRGRSLSMPKLLVANNQQATLNSVLDEPYLSVNSGQNVAASSYGGSVQAGTQVGIKPQIAEGDSLILSYTVSLSAFVGRPAAPGVPPARQQNSINSSATIPDGYTVVVGGIELESESRGVTQVPGLGDIPIVGELFKTRSNSANRSRFYVFIRASILRDKGFEDLKFISEHDIAKSGVDDGWPVVEPRVIR
jgi:general secretion pathway protein D